MEEKKEVHTIKIQKIKKKARHFMEVACDILEYLIAILVAISIIFTLITLVPEMKNMLNANGTSAQFLLFLGEIFNVVVGIEFMKMLCKPSAENVIEVLVFLVARHMIIGTHSALDNFLSVASIAILYTIRQIIRTMESGKKINKEMFHKEK